jgi:hypothetical protein
MRETLYTANVSGDNAVLEINLMACAEAPEPRGKCFKASDLRQRTAGGIRLDEPCAGEFFKNGERGVPGGDHRFR